MIVAKKLKAGALQLVLFVSTLIAVLLMCFLLLAHTQKLFVKKSGLMVALIQAADSGLTYSFDRKMRPGEKIEIPLQNDFGISVSVTNQYWGVLPLRKSIATKGKLSFDKLAFIGLAQPDNTALFLQDEQRPMVIAGNSQITGDAYLPERGIKPGNIRGFGYNKPQLVYGKKKKSTARLPLFADELNIQIRQLTSGIFEPKGESFAMKQGLVLKNSFKAPLKALKGSTIRLKQAQLSGHIMVWATRKIVVESSCILQDVVLIAPEIEIKRGFQGNLQAIASESITVAENCVLTYPSVLLVNQKKQQKQQNKMYEPAISIASNADIRGSVLFLQSSEEEKSFGAHIVMADNALLTGELYCMGNMDLRGNVFGKVTTKGFVALENGNIYQNHLFNGKIDRSLLPKSYGGLLYKNTQLNQVIKWLY
jgi:hypothetical protein